MATTPYPFVASTVLTASQLNSTFNIPTTTKTASHTLTAADAGTRVYMNSASATTITVNTSIFSSSDVVEIVNIGAGVCTITAGTCTVSTTGTLALVQNAGGRLVFTSASVSIFQADGVAANFKIAQVLQVTSATEVTTTSTSYVTSGLSLAITPTLNTSKILILTTMPVQSTVVAHNGNFTIFRGTVAGTNLATAVGFGVAYSDHTLNMSFAANFLDSPATTSATTYTVGMKTSSATNTVKAQVGNSTSTLTLIEVLA